jgi:hypothetical protein
MTKELFVYRDSNPVHHKFSYQNHQPASTDRQSTVQQKTNLKSQISKLNFPENLYNK